MKVVIIGGSASGMGTAAKLRRNDPNIEIVVYQKQEYVSLGACGIPYFLGDQFQDSQIMIARQIQWFHENNIVVKNNTLVTNIDFSNKQITFVKDNIINHDNYDKLVISTGANPIVPPFENINHSMVFTATTLEDAINLKNIIKSHKIKTINIVGAGFIGLELAEQLTNLGIKINLIELDSRIASKIVEPEISTMILEELVKHDVTVFLNEQVEKIVVDNENCLIGVKTNKHNLLNCDLVIIATGFRPATSFITDLKLDKITNGAIKVDTHGRTSINDVWSSGDCATTFNPITDQITYVPLASIASKFAKVVANDITNSKGNIFYGSIQTSALRIFDLEISRTGLNESECINLGIDYKIVTINDKDHTNYLPNQTNLTLKLIKNKTTNTLIGAQMAGSNNAILRNYALANMIWNKLPINDHLEQVDLFYAPPFSRATDIIHIGLSKLNK